MHKNYLMKVSFFCFFHISGLPVYGQISIFVILSCICIFLLSLNIAQYLWYRRYEILKKNSIKPLPRIDEVYYTVCFPQNIKI